MEVNTEITNKSWSNIDSTSAQNYLKYYPADTKISLSKFIQSLDVESTILDIGCGNAQLYPILKQFNDRFIYYGVDISDTLLEVAKNTVSEKDVLIKQDLFQFLNTNTDRFTFTVFSHLLECTESPDFMINKAARISDYIAIIWYDPPRYEFDSASVAKNPHTSDDGSLKPFIRRKIGANYWKHIIDNLNLQLVHDVKRDSKDVLEIYKT